MTVLAPHVGCRCYLKDERHLRCVDHAVTLVLAPVGPVLPPNTPECPSHIGEPESNCGRCRSDALERTVPAPAVPRASDAAIARARELFEAARAAKKETP